MLGTTLPAYTDFQALLAEIDPDGVIVCTQDRTHAGYIVQALAAGKRVYCEKPLCTSAEQCREILAAAARCKGEVFVTHNMRYGPAEQRIKALVDAGKIGRLLSLEFNEHLDRSHGADYFRRWHRYKENSGGLLIHKASHHFDAMNWLAASRPEVLTALGGLLFYGRNGRLRGERCLECAHAAAGRFFRPLLGRGSRRADGHPGRGSPGRAGRRCGQRQHGPGRDAGAGAGPARRR